PYMLLLFGLRKIDIDSVNAITATHKSKVVITGSKDKTLKGWDIKTKKQLFTLRGHQDEVTAVTVTSDDKLISGSKDKTLKVWNLKNRKLLFSLTGHDGWITAVTVTPDGKQLISSSRHGTIKVWNLETEQEELPLTGHEDKVTAVVITPDGKHLISASFDKTLKVWDLSSKKVIASFVGESALTCCAVAPNGVTIVVGEASGRIHFLEWERRHSPIT
ncbi:MAG: WD40 repeat domain-containing protein, partial [Coleofasciculus sp. Co-bin14]|nr:WD40 repeat domain-containing protein [Coleofasciculus sp. Co-bin14]